jgi:NAD-dependent oxidoreductase involved in siderophore biosynthesis
MSVHRKPARADQESSRQVTFRVEVDCAEPHAPADQTFIDVARRAVLDADEDAVSVTPVRD